MLAINQIKNQIEPVFVRRGVNKAILFGSYAKNVATEDSDIDLLVDLPKEKQGFGFFGLRGDLERMIGKQVDLISSCSIVPNSRIDFEIKNSGVLIYEKS